MPQATRPEGNRPGWTLPSPVMSATATYSLGCCCCGCRGTHLSALCPAFSPSGRVQHIARVELRCLLCQLMSFLPGWVTPRCCAWYPAWGSSGLFCVADSLNSDLAAVQGKRPVSLSLSLSDSSADPRPLGGKLTLAFSPSPPPPARVSSSLPC